MGALDDAIKEHLELKRRHGASEDELRRQEAEALGPGRREPVADPADEELGQELDDPDDIEVELPLGEPPLEDEPAEELDPEEDLHPEQELNREARLEPAAEAAPKPPVEAERTPPAPPAPIDPLEEPEPDEVPREESLEAPRRAPAATEPPAPPEDDEDVLEETPEFLQETPEHDRLWFEQKPPRDFDFDE